MNVGVTATPAEIASAPPSCSTGPEKPCTDPGSAKWKRAPSLGAHGGSPASARPVLTTCTASVAASVIARPPSAEDRYIRSATGARHSSPIPATPLRIPSRQPRLPELQSVSQPLVFTMVSERAKSPPP